MRLAKTPLCLYTVDGRTYREEGQHGTGAQGETGTLRALFAGWEETLVWSVVQGCMGKAWADSLDCPRAALLWVGDFLFLGGDAEAPVARALAGFLPGSWPTG